MRWWIPRRKALGSVVRMAQAGAGPGCQSPAKAKARPSGRQMR
jgi:hypothetical protein